MPAAQWFTGMGQIPDEVSNGCDSALSFGFVSIVGVPFLLIVEGAYLLWPGLTAIPALVLGGLCLILWTGHGIYFAKSWLDLR